MSSRWWERGPYANQPPTRGKGLRDIKALKNPQLKRVWKLKEERISSQLGNLKQLCGKGDIHSWPFKIGRDGNVRVGGCEGGRHTGGGKLQNTSLRQEERGRGTSELEDVKKVKRVENNV